MDRMLYVAMSGASETLAAQAVRANNLANVSTAGFQKDLVQARAMSVFGDGYPTRAYAMTERPATDFTEGALMSTQRDLDVAINGPGFFAVQSENGDVAYTRAGDFKITAEGQLSTGSGYLVLGDGGTIGIPSAERIDIGVDGTISIIPNGSEDSTPVIVDRLRLVNPDARNLYKGEDGLIRQKDGEEAPSDINVRIVQGALSASNVNAVEEMVNMIQLARQFELEVKLMETAEQNDEQSAQIMQV